MLVDPSVEECLEIAALAMATWPALRASLSPPFWRAHVRPAFVSAAAVGGLATLTAASAVWAPAGLRALVVVVCGFRLVGLWRSRANHGRSLRLPPGRLSFLPPLAAVADQRFLEKQAAEHGPVFKIGGFRRNVVCVVGLDRASALLRRSDADLKIPAMPFNRCIPKGFLRYMAASDHSTFRRVIQRGLSREFVDRQKASLTGAVASGLASMARACANRKSGGVAPGPFLHDMMFGCFMELVFGVGCDDPSLRHFERLYGGIDHLSVSPLAVRRARRAVSAIGAIVGKRAAGGRGLLSEIAAAEPEMASDPTLIGNLVFMVRVSGTDVAGLLAWVLSILGEQRSWLLRLRSEPSQSRGGGQGGLADRVIMEMLRLQQSEYINRVAVRPIEIEGFTVPARWAVRICVHESHRDPRVFADPETFDPDRFLGRDQSATGYAPFGLDRHACIGDHLTRTVGRIFAEELARGFDLEVTGNGPAEMGRAHWQPNRRLRARLTRRG